MSDSEGTSAVVDFTGHEVDDVAAAVQGVMVGLRTPWLREGAEQAVAGDDDSPLPSSARRFITVLELAYLVASADGFARAERQSLSYLLQSVTGSVVKQADLERHFSDLDQAVEAMGRRERMAASAADIEDDAGREEAILLTALIAMADGTLSSQEMAALSELAAHMNIAYGQASALVDRAAAHVKEALGMTYINHLAKEINCKIVYYGPGLCGKTTNLEHIFAASAPERKGKLISLATETDRTLFFDFMPLELGSVGGFKVRFHLYTVPGQVFYDASRKLVLRGADGVVFVADSQPSRIEANIESFENLETNIAQSGGNLADIPHIIQYNKRDLADIMTIEAMRADLNPHGAPEYEASAVNGDGVFPTLKGLSKLVLGRLAQGQP